MEDGIWFELGPRHAEPAPRLEVAEQEQLIRGQVADHVDAAVVWHVTQRNLGLALVLAEFLIVDQHVTAFDRFRVVRRKVAVLIRHAGLGAPQQVLGAVAAVTVVIFEQQLGFQVRNIGIWHDLEDWVLGKPGIMGGLSSASLA